MIALPDYRQRHSHTCGPVATRILCAALGVRYKESFLEDRLLCSKDEGTEPRNISTFLRSENFSVMDGNAEIDDLRHWTKLSRPVICLINKHYIVVSGVSRGRVLFNDPDAGPGRLKFDEFLAKWHCDNYLGHIYHQWSITAWR